MSEYIIGIDAGTTGIRTFCFNKAGNVISSAYSEFKQHFPKPGWVEHDAEEIWAKTEKLILKAIRNGKLKPEKAVAIGITNQRETTVLFDKDTGKPVYNAIVWQCRRTSDFCSGLKKEGLEPTFRRKTGLVVDAYFSGTKIRWILDNVKGVRAKAEKGKVLFGTIDTYLLYRLTNGKSHKTDHTNASRTLIFNIEKKEWDKELLKILQIPEAILPETHNSSTLFGRTESVAGLPDGIPISSLVGDQQGALFGQLCTEPGEAKNTYGTGCFLLFNTGNKLQISKNNLITTLACGPEGKTVYCLEGSIFIGGAVIQYLRDNLRFFKESKLSEKMAASVNKEDEVVFVPAFSGLGAPYWDMNARGAILGLTRDTTQEQITRAALKSIALQSYELVEAMENDTGSKLKILKVDGGATANNWLMQYQSDILGKKIVRPSNLDTTVLGAAYLAGLERGFYSSVAELKKKQKASKEFSPKMGNSQREKEIRIWKDSVKRILTPEK
ncbi:glycerol kinase [Leptospira wolffii]|uniref:Glycerol kinase n=1 Tax=Leptospira wolffii TaxID=409998 RepID=A0A2M9Z6W3_9LEPT|nr:glycerol kinase GlpK [Leptospira wolffii]PJZ64169.1 glycerol kinase [Leptospira wolffii]TGK56842.1 glycerol kinase [Leptospira wolffii]TGK71576.1 glycerol kinase [Leptospira wolffii]TGK75567.1 glycerol kinase [Leptospira wolffii]TGL32943.1 glycerol kinase [Leptospira wolffii]